MWKYGVIKLINHMQFVIKFDTKEEAIEYVKNDSAFWEDVEAQIATFNSMYVFDGFEDEGIEHHNEKNLKCVHVAINGLNMCWFICQREDVYALKILQRTVYEEYNAESIEKGE